MRYVQRIIWPVLYSAISFRFGYLGMQDHYVAMQNTVAILTRHLSDMSRIDTRLE